MATLSSFTGKQTAKDGEMVIALVDGSEATVKKFYRESGGWIRLQPANTTMQPLTLSGTGRAHPGRRRRGHQEVLEAGAAEGI